MTTLVTRCLMPARASSRAGDCPSIHLSGAGLWHSHICQAPSATAGSQDAGRMILSIAESANYHQGSVYSIHREGACHCWDHLRLIRESSCCKCSWTPNGMVGVHSAILLT